MELYLTESTCEDPQDEPNVHHAWCIIRDGETKIQRNPLTLIDCESDLIRVN